MVDIVYNRKQRLDEQEIKLFQKLKIREESK